MLFDVAFFLEELLQYVAVFPVVHQVAEEYFCWFIAAFDNPTQQSPGFQNQKIQGREFNV